VDLEFLDKASGCKSRFLYLESNEFYDKVVFVISLSFEGFCEQKLDFGCFLFPFLSLLHHRKKSPLYLLPCFTLTLLYLFALCFLLCSRVIEVSFLSSHPFLNIQFFSDWVRKKSQLHKRWI
jgi:hypothetical protein